MCNKNEECILPRQNLSYFFVVHTTFVSTWMAYKGKKNDHEILAALQYKPLYNISRSEKWGLKKIQAAYGRLLLQHAYG